MKFDIVAASAAFCGENEIAWKIVEGGEGRLIGRYSFVSFFRRGRRKGDGDNRWDFTLSCNFTDKFFLCKHPLLNISMFHFPFTNSSIFD